MLDKEQYRKDFESLRSELVSVCNDAKFHSTMIMSTCLFVATIFHGDFLEEFLKSASKELLDTESKSLRELIDEIKAKIKEDREEGDEGTLPFPKDLLDDIDKKELLGFMAATALFGEDSNNKEITEVCKSSLLAAVPLLAIGKNTSDVLAKMKAVAILNYNSLKEGFSVDIRKYYDPLSIAAKLKKKLDDMESPLHNHDKKEYDA